MFYCLTRAIKPNVTLCQEGLATSVQILCFPKYTFCILMDSSFWFDTLNLGLSSVHIYVCQVILFKKDCILLSDDHYLANSVDHDKMQRYAAFLLGLHCFKSTCLLVSRIQRVKNKILSIKIINYFTTYSILLRA